MKRALAMTFCAGALGLLGLLGGCGTSDTSSQPQAGVAGQAHYIVTADATPFYKSGPVQPSGPDLSLKKGQLLTMIERRYGYSRVIDPDGDAGYVPTEDIAPAPANQTAVLTPSSKKSHGQPAPLTPADYGDQPNDAPLPTKQPRSDEPAPSFRY